MSDDTSAAASTSFTNNLAPKKEKLEGGGAEEKALGPDGETMGQYFVDHATGQYYFQSNSGETMTVVSAPGEGDSGVDNHGNSDKNGLPPRLKKHTIGNSSGSARSKNAGGSQDKKGGADDQVVVNTGDDQFQTVTIVPSEGNTGEVSYVLIVQQPDEKSNVEKMMDEDEEDVYDFDGEAVEGENEDSGGSKGLRKSQTVAQACHMCNYCNYTTPKRFLLSRHMKSHSEERPHKCSVCERGFKTLPALQNHVNTHTGTKPHRCKFCDASFTTSGELVRHVRYRHTYEKPHKCTECDYSSVELSKLKRHMRCHTGERPYQCSHCTYASPDTFKLKRHLRIHTGEKPYQCDICHATFSQSNSLKAHRLIHTGDKPVFQCEFCPSTCGRKTDLRLHVQKLHTAVQPVHCKLCGKAFPDLYTLKVHKRTHQGERCFKCDLCPYSTVSQRHLESHMLIHTGQKPFECDQCDQSFRQRQLLKRHQNLYHNPNYVPVIPKEKTHECPECGRNFRHKGNLIRHMALHDPDSSAKEKAIALKLGRQKKIQIIDGQEVEVMADEEEELDGIEIGEDFDEDGMDAEGSNVMAVQGQDGQHYVVLEVIQMNEQDGAVDGGKNCVDPSGALPSDMKKPEPLGNVEDSVEEDFNVETLLNADEAKRGPSVVKKALSLTGGCESDKKADLDNCFGFEEEDEENA